MLLIVSPSKALDYETPLAPAVLKKATEPLFVEQASELISVLRKKSPKQVAKLMDLSDQLASLNVERYATWAAAHEPSNSRPAVLAFDGDVYDGLQARSLKPAELEWAQQHVIILSGLYGAMRPLDRLQPYRLEMGSALRTKRGKDLYAFWGDRVAGYLNQRQAAETEPVLINLASIEYARVALRKGLRARVIDCVFEDWKTDRYKIISFFAKRARGLMVRHLAEQGATAPEAMRGFAADGYAWDAAASAPERWVFRRRVEG